MTGTLQPKQGDRPPVKLPGALVPGDCYLIRRGEGAGQWAIVERVELLYHQTYKVTARLRDPIESVVFYDCPVQVGE